MRPARWALLAPAAMGALVPLIAVLALGGCSPAAKDRWLRTFFDDPPTPAAQTMVPPAAAGAADPDTAATAAAPVPIHEHAPFAAGDCRACHDLGGTRSFRGTAGGRAAAGAADARQERLVTGPERLCTGCHGDLEGATLAAAGYEVVHAPLTGGGCLFCHDPHQSSERALLREGPPRVLCLQCHGPPVLAEVAGHRDPAALACLDCHDPHASDQRALLREGGG